MSRGLNKVHLIGRIGKDPEGGTIPSTGSSVCNFSLATGEEWKNKETGAKEERTEWHKITVFGRLAEVALSNLKKGDLVYLEGKLRTRSFDKQGVTHFTTEIVADEMEFLTKHDPNGQRAGNR
mgnify:CR=1 FL=1